MKARNLLKDEHYTHPFTRNLGRASRLTVTPEGEILELPGDMPVPKTELTDLDIVNYYYRSVKLEENNPLMYRDTGSIRWLVERYGLDRTLFALDSLIETFASGEDRGSTPPSVIECSNHISEGDVRLSEATTIARQYGVSSC